MADDLATLGYKADLTGINKINRGLDSIGKESEKTEGRIGKSSKGINSSLMSVSKIAGAAALAMSAIGAKNIFSGITDESEQLQRNLLRTQALINSTGKSAQITADDLYESARDLALATLESTEGIMNAQQMMLTFKNISVQSYDEVIETAINLSSVTGQGLSSAMVQLGKALEDPVTGMTAMSRSGVSFSKAQKDMVKDMAASNDLLGAQNLILNELASQYGGVARNEAKGLAGAQDTFSQAIQELNIGLDETIGLTESMSDGYSEAASFVFYLRDNTDALVKSFASAAAVLGAYAVVQGGLALKSIVAMTTATRALAAATSFVTGPWGLLVGAIGVAATVFATTAGASDGITEALDRQGVKVDELNAKYEKMSNKRFGADAVDLQKQLIELDQQIADATSRYEQALSEPVQFVQTAAGEIQIPNPSIDESASALEKLTSKRTDLEALYQTMVNFFDESIPDKWQSSLEGGAGKVDEINKAYQRWLESVRNAADPTRELYQEIDKINTAMSKGDLPLSVGNARIKQLRDQIFELNESLSDNFGELEQWKSEMIAAVDPAIALRNEMARVSEGMRTGFIGSELGTKRLQQLQDEIDALSETAADPFDSIASGAMQAMQAMSMMFESGSKGAQMLSIAMQGVQLSQAAMSGSVGGMIAGGIGIVASIDAMFSDIEDNLEEIQSQQGLNEWDEKASSIDDSVSTVASATEDLVGINTDMLAALENLQSSLLSAAGVVVSGVETPTATANLKTFSMLSTGVADLFGSNLLTEMIDFLSFNWLFKGISSLLGGSSKVTNEGIEIIGGTMSDLLNDVTVQAFQELSYKKWRWGSTKTTTEYADVSDDVSNQFLLVFNSLADAVYEGATMLGMSSDAATEAINSFVLDTITISLEDMTVDEQAEALEEVFSEIFNNLTESVIPWLSDLQQTGEDLGTTLSRVASEVSIADMMVEYFGVTFGDKMANPEAYATAIDNITDMIGSVDDLADSVSSFVDAFASDDEKLSILFDSLTSALSDVGLALPSTAEEMYALMEGIDATTEEGQEQIATLLELTDTASSYYDLLEDANEAMADLSDTFASAVMDIYDVSDGVEQISLDAALAAARLGDFSLAELLDVSDYTLDTADYASLAEYNLAQAEAANKLLELSELSAAQSGDVQTEQLDTLLTINENIVASNEYLAALSTATSDNADAIERLAQAS